MKTNRTALLGARFALCALGAFLLSAAASPSACALSLAENGRSDYVIVLANDALPAEETAARELQDYLSQITSATLPIQREAQVPPSARQILVGPGERVKKLLPSHSWKTLAADAIVVKTLPGKLILAGGRPRGTLYAVYSFLEDTLGVRWWTASESTVPRSAALEIPELDVSYAPKLRYREAFNREPVASPLFAARMKLNGHMSPIPDSLGGHYTLLGWCHTAYEFLPPEKYFADHPEWYSLVGGKRTTSRSQLCWTNEQMLRELTRQALKRIRKNPSAGIISISQNDCKTGACECEQCRAIEQREGSPSGPLLYGVNAVAAEVAKEFPEFLVETLAYQYTRKAPAKLRPAKNVLVRLCSIEADNTHALSSQNNAAFRDDLLAWSAIAPNLFVWNYVTNFSNYLIPHPNLLPLGEDLRFFAENNVIGVFEQGDVFNSLAGDLLPLRTWLVAHLLWDPTRDQKALQKEFLEGYYGPAAPYLEQYIDLVHAPVRASQSFRLDCYNTDTAWLSTQTLAQAQQLFDEAARAVAGNPELQRRVQRERLVLDHLQLLRYDFASCVRAADDSPNGACSGYEAKVREYAEAAEALGVRSFSEVQEFASYIPQLKARCRRLLPPKLPAAGEMPGEGYFELQEDTFRLAAVGDWSQIVDDAKASNGKAVKMGGHHKEWAVQLTIDEGASYAGAGPWTCYFLVRCQAKANHGIAFTYGIFDPATRRYPGRDSAPLELAADGEYHSYAIPVDELKPGAYFWIAPQGNAETVDSIYVDRICLQKSKEKE